MIVLLSQNLSDCTVGKSGFYSRNRTFRINLFQFPCANFWIFWIPKFHLLPNPSDNIFLVITDDQCFAVNFYIFQQSLNFLGKFLFFLSSLVIVHIFHPISWFVQQIFKFPCLKWDLFTVATQIFSLFWIWSICQNGAWKIHLVLIMSVHFIYEVWVSTEVLSVAISYFISLSNITFGGY